MPAVAACSAVGDLDHARQHLHRAERSLPLWDGTAWEAALAEARSHLAVAGGDPAGALDELRRAADGFERAGQPLDVGRCRRAIEALAG